MTEQIAATPRQVKAAPNANEHLPCHVQAWFAATMSNPEQEDACMTVRSPTTSSGMDRVRLRR